MKTNTRLLHDRFAGDKANTGATLTPIYQTSAFGNATAEGLEAIFKTGRQAMPIPGLEIPPLHPLSSV